MAASTALVSMLRDGRAQGARDLLSMTLLCVAGPVPDVAALPAAHPGCGLWRLSIHAIEKLVAVAVRFWPWRRLLANFHHLATTARLVGGPHRQTRTVGIAAFGEVRPVGRHRFGKLPVVRFPGEAGLRAEIIEGVIDLREVINTRCRERMNRQFGRAGRTTREVIAING